MSIASVFGRPVSWYSTHPTVTCPDCLQVCDPDFGDHGGDCLDFLHLAPHGTAVDLIRRYAERHLTFSINDFRQQFDDAAITPNARGRAFTEAERRGHIERDGTEPSTGESAKGAEVKRYRSLRFQPAMQRKAS